MYTWGLSIGLYMYLTTNVCLLRLYGADTIACAREVGHTCHHCCKLHVHLHFHVHVFPCVCMSGCDPSGVCIPTKNCVSCIYWCQLHTTSMYTTSMYTTSMYTTSMSAGSTVHRRPLLTIYICTPLLCPPPVMHTHVTCLS